MVAGRCANRIHETGCERVSHLRHAHGWKPFAPARAWRVARVVAGRAQARLHPRGRDPRDRRERWTHIAGDARADAQCCTSGLAPGRLNAVSARTAHRRRRCWTSTSTISTRHLRLGAALVSQRSERNALRTSDVNRSGSSQAAKWPPLSTAWKYTTFG